MTLAEFLAWHDNQKLRFEFDGFESVAMTGATAGHQAIVATLPARLVMAAPERR